MMLAGLARVTGAPPDYHEIRLRVGAPPGRPPADGRWSCPVELDAPGRPLFASAIAVINTRVLDHKADPEEYGRELGRMVFGAGNVMNDYQSCTTALRSRGDQLRVRLQIDVLDLQTLAWERIFHPLDGKWFPLGAAAASPFSRYAPAGTWLSAPAPTERPLRLLCVIASPPPGNRYELDTIATSERAALHQTLDAARALKVETTWLESGSASPPTLLALRKALTRGAHLVHFLCHGARTANGTVLYLEGDAGEIMPVTADEVVASIQSAATPPRFVFFAACETAARRRTDGFLPLGPLLARDTGVPAVLAMSSAVGLETARLFTTEFYARLLTHGMVDLAVNEARAVIQGEWDFGAPVLYSRLADNQLIDFEVGQVERYLSINATATRRAGSAIRAAASRDDHPLVSDLMALVEELTKSHRQVVDIATRFRETEAVLPDFEAQFRAFAAYMKGYYYGQTWTAVTTRCHQVFAIAGHVKPGLQELLPPDDYAALSRDLDWLAQGDSDLLFNFEQVLGTMDAACDDVIACLDRHDTDGALARKRRFDAEISPTFRRSRALLQEMDAATGRVSAA